jgi:hypothetical protein
VSPCWAGDIQVFADPGLRVYLDDDLMGVTTEAQDGLYLLDVDPGAHTLRILKDGFLPQHFEVNTGELPIEIRVDAADFVPQPTPAEPRPPAVDPVPTEPATPQQVGQLVVISAPQSCTVSIDGREERKRTPHLTLGGLPAGPHTITFRRDGYRPISDRIEVPAGAELTVRGNLIEGTVEVIHTGTGSLRLTSTPTACTVRLDGRAHQKTRGRLNLSFIPAGWHELEVAIPGRTLSTEILILDGRKTLVDVSFVDGDAPFTMTHLDR